MPEQTVSSTSTKTYEAPRQQSHSLSLTLAWIVIVILLLALVALYIVYFVGLTSNGTFGQPWRSDIVSDTTTSIAPAGQSIFFVNGGSSLRGSNPDFLFISIPKNIPYINRTFIIYNTSSSNQLELRASEGVVTTLNGNTIASYFIQPLSSTVFYWYSKDQVLPLVVGGNPLQNS